MIKQNILNIVFVIKEWRNKIDLLKSLIERSHTSLHNDWHNDRCSFPASCRSDNTIGYADYRYFVGMIWGWMTCGMLWPSLAGILLLGITEYASSPQASLGMALTHNTVIAMLASFLVIGFINASQLMGVISQWIITRKFFAGKPWIFVLFLLTAEFIAAAVFHPVILMMLFFSMIFSIAKAVGYTKDDLFPVYMLLGIGITAGNGAMWAPFMPNALFMHGLISTSLGGGALSNFQYLMCFTLPMYIAILIFVLVGKFIIRIDTSKFVAGVDVMMQNAAAEGKTQMTEDQRFSTVILILFVLGLAAPAILPGTWPLIGFLSRLGVVGISMILVIALLVIRRKNGNPISDFKKLISDGMTWDMIFLTAAIMVVSTALTSQGTGITAALAVVMTPVFSRFSLVTICLIIGVILCVTSQFAMNMVLEMAFAPLLAPVLVSVGYNPMIMVMVVYFSTMLAMLAPSGSVMAAMIYSATDWVKKENIYKICLPWVIITFVFYMAICFVFPDMFCVEFRP